MRSRKVTIGSCRCVFVKVWAMIAFLSTVFLSPVHSMDDKTYASLMMFSHALEEIKQNYVDDIDSQLLVRSAIQGMMASLDPHSGYLTPNVLHALNTETMGGFSGVGLRMDKIGGQLTVISSIDGSPAHRAGIKTGDRIITIDNEPTQPMTIWESAAKLKGPQGSVVRITCIRPGNKEPFECRLSRDVIPLQSVRGIMLDKAGHGYLAITQFRSNTIIDMVDALEEMESSGTGVTGLIIDLRNNPGGHLNQAIEMVDLFMEEGVIVSIQGRQRNSTDRFEANPSIVKRQYPLIVLINGGSASSSEIVAGALQDHKRAIILGSNSFGKGSVQTVRLFKDGYGLKYTIARYYTPNNRSIQDKGIVPDIQIETIAEDTVPVEPGRTKNQKMDGIELRQDTLIRHSLELLVDKKYKSKL